MRDNVTLMQQRAPVKRSRAVFTALPQSLAHGRATWRGGIEAGRCSCSGRRGIPPAPLAPASRPCFRHPSRWPHHRRRPVAPLRSHQRQNRAALAPRRLWARFGSVGGVMPRPAQGSAAVHSILTLSSVEAPTAAVSSLCLVDIFAPRG